MALKLLGETHAEDMDVLSLKLEALAMLGNRKNFFAYLNKHKATFDNYYFIAHCAQLLVQNTKDDVSDIYSKVSRFQALMATEDRYYKNIIRRQSYEAMLKGANILKAKV